MASALLPYFYVVTKLLTERLCLVDAGEVRLPLALDFEASADGLNIRSSLADSGAAGELFRQYVCLDQETRLAVRLPEWAEQVTATDGEGAALAVTAHDGWLSTREPVREVTWIYRGGIRHERRPGRHVDDPSTLQEFAYLGPKLLGQVDNQAPAPLSNGARGRSVRFWAHTHPESDIRRNSL